MKSKVTIQPISVKSDEDDAAEPIAVNAKSQEPVSADTGVDTEPVTAQTEESEPAAEQSAGTEQSETEPAAETEEAAKEKEEPASATSDSEESEAEPAEGADESDLADSGGEEKEDKAAAPMSPEEQEAAAKKAEEKEAAHTAAIRKLVDNEQYFLPINSVESRKTKRFIALGAVLIVLLAVAWVDVALDAGLVQLGGLKPVTHFFAAKSAAATSSLLPTVTTKTYTAPLTRLTFRYQSNWTLASSGSTAQEDVIALNPVASNPSASVAVSFLSQFTLAKSSFGVKYVHYQKLPHAISGNDVYLRDMVYQDGFGHINLVASLGNDNSVKTGQTLQSIDQDFLNPDGKTSSLFAITVFKTSGGKVGFSSVTEAQQFITSAQYQQARAILLSTAPAKS